MGAGHGDQILLSAATEEVLAGELPPGVALRELGEHRLREEKGRAAEETLVDYLASRRLLVVLDNCEHLVGACARLAERLLRAAPGLTVLATSREALGISGERTVGVPALSLPPLAAPGGDGGGGLEQYEAVRLFIERAQAVSPDFHVTDENAPAVAEICVRLDGTPLAIELAAARLRIMSPETLLARLSHRFRLLTGGSRTAARRQQTLAATIDWSHDLLPGEEKVLIRRLSVFRGGCTLAAAEAVCAGDGQEA